MFHWRLVGLLLGSCVVASAAIDREPGGPIYEIIFERALAEEPPAPADMGTCRTSHMYASACAEPSPDPLLRKEGGLSGSPSLRDCRFLRARAQRSGARARSRSRKPRELGSSTDDYKHAHEHEKLQRIDSRLRRRGLEGGYARHESRAGDSPADWCAGHGVPESKCTKCNPGLIPKFKEAGDWCAEHGFPESVCPVCNSVAPPGSEAAAAADWCVEHGLPESKCTKCNPSLIPHFKEAGDWCAEHGFPESVCPICNPAPRPAGFPPPSGIAPGTRIRFRSAEIERAAGIAAVPAGEVSLDIGVTCAAHLDFDRNRMADIRASVPGVVKEVLVDLGDRVEVGAELFVLESHRVGDLQAQLQAAHQRVEVARANAARERRLHRSQVSSAREVELANQELEAAEAELKSLESGLRIAGASGSDHTGRYTLRAPKSGTVVRRPAMVGTFAAEDVSLATVADMSAVWALLEMREIDAASVRLGQQVAIDVDGLPGRTFSGEITWIAAEVDPRTRTVAARAEVSNPDGLLRAHQFARATIRVAAPENAVTVPRDAIQRLGEETVVFLRTGDGLYEPRQVDIGRTNGRLVQVLGSISAGTPVVTEGAFLLKTELSKESIGAGCCEVEPPGAD